MEIQHPRLQQVIDTPCTGCPCHWNAAIQMGDRLKHGCCGECGCPKNQEGWNFWVQERGAAPRPQDAMLCEVLVGRPELQEFYAAWPRIDDDNVGFAAAPDLGYPEVPAVRNVLALRQGERICLSTVLIGRAQEPGFHGIGFELLLSQSVIPPDQPPDARFRMLGEHLPWLQKVVETRAISFDQPNGLAIAPLTDAHVRNVKRFVDNYLPAEADEGV